MLSRADVSVLGCGETSSDCPHKAGHCDLLCSGSTSEIPPLPREVQPSPLDSKTQQEITLLPLLLLVVLCFPSCVLLTFVWPQLVGSHVPSAHPAPAAPTAVLANAAVIHPEHVAQIRATC